MLGPSVSLCLSLYVLLLSTQLTQARFVAQHQLVPTFLHYVDLCSKDAAVCDSLVYNISSLCIRIANDHAQLLLHNTATSLFQETFYVLPPNGTIGKLINRILAVHAFAQGDIVKVSNVE